MSTQIKHSGRAHALLSASSAHRWLKCPPSAVAAEAYTNEGSDFTREGTLAHEVAEAVCQGADRKGLVGIRDDITQEMIDCAEGYRDYIQEQIHGDDALVMLEHHLSGIIIIGLMGLVTMYIGGTDKKWFLWLFAIGGTAVVLVLLVSDYAMLRVSTWMQIEFQSPNLNPLGSAWQTLQGMSAIGSGGFFGRGLGNSQQKYGYVSQPQNDFIFTIICEELGFVGALGVVLLFGLLVWRGFRIAAKAPDKFCSIVVYGLVIKVALQTILNIAVVTNTIPNTGIALPFFSSGGTSLILQIFEMGIVLAISRYSYQKR